MTARRHSRSSVSRKWSQVRVGLVCDEGGHQIEAGAWAMFTRASWRQTVLCETHALEHGGFKPPNSSFGFHAEPGEDVRARQVGGDE